ncbi:hypothetical protein C0Q70_09177 [Pomacea canaliculata]|uniref:Trichohyalin-plectin-homology domain-containing protein n=3 Tax=Pomacea canaliculata TaxID=400727 RepID=A0A2T7P925_POMCA|nr:hypothetical protein C0Q70_09177 [Pomacea canaliculata]
MHGRRKGNARATPELPQAPGGMILPDGTDLRQMTVLSKAEWLRIQEELNRRHIEEEQLKRIRNEREEQKKRSKEMVKNWSNTFYGQSQQRLEARKAREAKEEEEKRLIDIEEAKFQAEKRKAAIEKAKTQQYYQTDRVKNFHSALILTEVLKEREAQIELAHLKAKASEGEEEEWLNQMNKEHEYAMQKEHSAAFRRMQAARDNQEFVKKQIREHLKQKDLVDAENIAEGEELKRLTIAYEVEKERLKNLKLDEQMQTNHENTRQIEDVKKMNDLKAMREEEEDEECRIFAAAKRKMMKLSSEREKEIYLNKQRRLDRIREKLAAQMKQKISDEDERIERVLREEEEKYIETEKEKETKLRKTLQDIAEHRSKQMLEMEEKKKQARKEELEGVELRKAADEIFRRNEMEKMERYLEDNKKNKEYLFLQMNERKANDEAERDLSMDKANQELMKKEEEQFQEYARKVITHCEQGGRNVYPLRKAAVEGIGGGLGPVLPGRGGIRPSYMVQDVSGRQMPHYQRSTTEDVKKLIGGKTATKIRLGFVW